MSDDIKKRLASYLTLASLFEMDVLTMNKDTKIVVGEEELGYEGTPQRITVGDIMKLGRTPSSLHNYKVLSVDRQKNELELKEVQFFRAKFTTGDRVDIICVVAADGTEAGRIVKAYGREHPLYERVLSIVPTSNFFQPFIDDEQLD